MPTLKYCDRDEYLRLLKAEVEAQSPSESQQPIDDAALTSDIDALREELRLAVTGAVQATVALNKCLRTIAEVLS